MSEPLPAGSIVRAADLYDSFTPGDACTVYTRGEAKTIVIRGAILADGLVIVSDAHGRRYEMRADESVRMIARSGPALNKGAGHAA